MINYILSFDTISILDSRDVAQLGRAPGLGPGGRRFESCHPDHFCNFQSDHIGTWLSLVEHLVWDQGVAGSNPVVPTTKKDLQKGLFFMAF